MALSDLLQTYWYIIAIVVLVVFFFIWKNLDAYTKLSIKKVLSGKTLLIILFVVGWWLWHRFGGSSVVFDSDRWMPVILFAFLTGIYYIGKLRYDTQQFIAPNFHGSFCKPPFKVNGFYIFAIDSFNAGGLSWEHATRIAIVREETCELFPFGAVSIASMGFVSKYELPEEVTSFIENNKFLKKANKDCYYGWFDDLSRVDWSLDQLKEKENEKVDPKSIYSLVKAELGVDNPKVSTLLWLYRNQSKAVNKQTEYYDSTVESVEKGVEHHQRVKDAYVNKKDERPQGYDEGNSGV